MGKKVKMVGEQNSSDIARNVESIPKPFRDTIVRLLAQGYFVEAKALMDEWYKKQA